MKNLLCLVMSTLAFTSHAFADGVARPEIVCQQTDGDQWYEVQVVPSVKAGEFEATLFFNDVDTGATKVTVGRYTLTKKFTLLETYPSRSVTQYISKAGKVLVNGQWQKVEAKDFVLESSTVNAEGARNHYAMKSSSLKFDLSSPLLMCE